MGTRQRFLVAVAMTSFAMLLAGAADFQLHSSAFSDNGPIPSRHTCDGANVSPPLAWGDPPAGTKSFALVVDDPDAPDPAAPKMRWVHWVLYGLPGDTRELKEGIHGPSDLPHGTKVGSNDFGESTWKGPCPPAGRHRYVFTLYALDDDLDDSTALSKRSLEEAMAGHILAHTMLIGTYEKQK